MKKLHIIIPALMVFLLPLALTPIAKAETRRVWGFRYEGMALDIYAPYQGYAGGKITVRVRVEAKEYLKDAYVYIQLQGSKKYGYESWVHGWYVLDDVDLFAGIVRDESYEITIPSDVDSGLIYGYAWCKWKVLRWLIYWVDYSYAGPFNVVYLRNLLDAYDKLRADLETTRNLSYILALTTIVFIATTAYLAIRKKEIKPS